MRQKLPYFAAIAPMPPAGRPAPISLQPAAPLFRPSIAAVEFVELQEHTTVSRRQPAKIASSKATPPAAGQPQATTDLHQPAAGRTLQPSPQLETTPTALPAAAALAPGQSVMLPPAGTEPPRRPKETAAVGDTIIAPTTVHPAPAALVPAALAPAALTAATHLPRLLTPHPPLLPAGALPAHVQAPQFALHIGTLEVRIIAPMPVAPTAPLHPQLRVAPARQRSTQRLARGFGVFGLGQS